MSSDGYFMYFAFGSNLLKERLQLKNPSATFYSTGRLKDYVLRFGLWGERVQCRWNGGVATIEENPGAEVWGVVWKLSKDNLASLDKQEEVYSPMEVSVETEALRNQFGFADMEGARHWFDSLELESREVCQALAKC
ncbi:gamma-glutamylcyclotransferase a isoform X2 [Alosa sapidissima]|uniref:gamma-glutamylcyclotransferase a isoform X2 n=1 Tax=Alosa sapidissima TaxID=34773 RepID=UPI001C08211E|nr:gamma-glutamylcyclotransferase a isoform X2 [Alosa sapidissima]